MKPLTYPEDLQCTIHFARHYHIQLTGQFFDISIIMHNLWIFKLKVQRIIIFAQIHTAGECGEGF